jgi:L-lactate utilization protein LutB
MISTPYSVRKYRSRLKKALKNEFLGTTLDNFAAAYRISRAKAFEGINLEDLIHEIAKGKDASIPCLEDLFAQFKSRAEPAGTKIHVAQTASEANEIIASIAKANNVRKIVKGKSMTAEETFLNDHLEKEGYQVTETDLGEWIIQMRHEGPYHMVMPAIHLSRKQVAELFTKVTGKYKDPDDIDGMVKFARRRLRQAFIEADMGITGANFAIAETGTIGLVTNEGNGRLVTTLPKVHVALVGFDKLIPDIKSAFRILKALPRNATGQAQPMLRGSLEPMNALQDPEAAKKCTLSFWTTGGLLWPKTLFFHRPSAAFGAEHVPTCVPSTSWSAGTTTATYILEQSGLF